MASYDDYYPKKLTSLYDPQYSQLSPARLVSACATVFSGLNVTQDQADKLEAATRAQALSNTWFENRLGRITASQFGKICNQSRPQRDPPLPAILQTYSVAMEHRSGCNWGMSHETLAVRAYEDVMRRERHNDFKITPSGLVINPSYPHLGATPDSIVECSCHGRGVLEVKCPFKHRYSPPCMVVDDVYTLHPHYKTSAICRPSLRNNHNVYYQVQGQMAICNVQYCDFVCWTTQGIHVERIQFDPAFWNQMKRDLDEYFLSSVLPILLTKRAPYT